MTQALYADMNNKTIIKKAHRYLRWNTFRIKKIKSIDMFVLKMMNKNFWVTKREYPETKNLWKVKTIYRWPAPIFYTNQETDAKLLHSF
jgi:hypothetical protein